MNKKTKSIAVVLLSTLGIILPVSFYSNSVSAYTATINTDDNISLDILPTGDGTTIRSTSVNIQSDCRAGYNLTIATPNGSSLYKYSNNTQSSSTASFTSVDGTSALSSSNNTNKWGYTLTNNPTSSTIFSPLSSTASTIKTSTETASPDNDIDDIFNINYGIKADSNIEPGNYQMADDGNGNAGSIVYYLTMNPSCTDYTVQFNPNGGTGIMDNQYIEPGIPTSLSEGSFESPALGTSYTDANNNTISGTPTTYWKFNGWNTAADGTGTAYTDQASVTDLAQAGQSITLYARWQATPVLVVNYEGNGMEFDGGTTQNKVGYYNGCSTKYLSSPSYSHTANINDDGTQIGATKYDNNLATKEVITVPGADSLHATITYGTENNWDMLYVFEGTYTGSVARNMEAGQLAKYMGGSNSTTTVELDIPGDTATFAFYSDGSGQYWGYHASVVGYYDNEPASYASTTQICGRTPVSGEYQNPAADEDRLFQGWSENSSATTPDYTTSEDIINNLSGDNNQIKTLYAIWTPRYHINYVNNCRSYASANEACTEAVSNDTSTQTIDLDSNGSGNATLGTNNYNSWLLTGWKIASWNTSADGTGIDYPASSTYSVTNQGVGDGVVLYAHWVPLYSIQYDGNGAENPNGMGTTDGSGIKSVKQINVGEGDPVTLLPSNFKRAGYGFAGWSTNPNTTVGGNDKIYGPMETISAPAYPNNDTGIITMYAVWVPTEKDGNNNPVYLQDFGKNECDNLTSATFNSSTSEITPGSVIALTDKRDNQVYTIAKLADGNCWMVDNLRLESTGTLGNNINDPTVTNESLSQGYGGKTGVYGNFVGLAKAENNINVGPSVNNTIYKSSTNPPVDTYNPPTMLEDIGTLSSPSNRFPRYNNDNIAKALSDPTFTEDYIDTSNPALSGNYKKGYVLSYGNYYTWAAAIANTSYYSDSSTSEATSTSICPSGWHLPSSNGTNKEFNVLYQSYGGEGNDQTLAVNERSYMSERFRVFPNNYIYSGAFFNGSSLISGRSGDYLSRSSGNSYEAYRLFISSYALSPNSPDDKGDGGAIRCIADSTYRIQYNGNGADNPNGMGTIDARGKKSVKQTGITEGIDVTLLASNFKRDGYGFAGWSTDPDAWAHFTDNDNTNDPIIYGPMETIIAPSYPTGGIVNLYAVWVPAKNNGNGLVYLQDFSLSQCNNLTSTDFNSTTGKITATKNSIVALTDKRDNMVYTIAKLADGKCWMVENLRLEHEGTIGDNTNDPAITNQSLSQGYGNAPGIYGSFVGLAESESSNFSNVTTSNTIYKSSANPPVETYNTLNNTLEDIGTANSPAYRIPRYNNYNTKNLIDSTTYNQDYTNVSSPNSDGIYSADNLYSYGNYYNWAAAMANTNYYSSVDTSKAANTSICPSGWHLPSGSSTNDDFGTLSQRYGGQGNNQVKPALSKHFRAFPNNFVYSGYISSSSVNGRSSSGHYWSTAVNSSSHANHLTLSSTSLFPSHSDTKYYGYNVRCVADDTYTIQYDGNGADNPNGMGATDAGGKKSVKQVEISEGTKVTLLASNFKRDGYGFAGWSTDPDAWAHFTDNDNTNDPTIYGPMEDVVINSNVSDTLNITMYAVWVPAKKDGSNNSIYLQDFTNSDCNALTSADFNTSTGVITPGSVIALTDKRDNQVYTVAKLADGNCWMTENFRLGHFGTVGNNINDSSVTNQSLSQGYGGTTGTYGNFVGLADSEPVNNFNFTSTPNSIYKSDGSGSLFDSINNTLEDVGISNTPVYRFPRYNGDNTLDFVDSTTYTQNYANASSPSDSGTNYRTESNLYSFGNYYTWAAAMANTNYYTDSSTSEVAGTSVCPSNWHLPSSGTVADEYDTLSRSYGGTGNSQNGTTESGDIMSSRLRTFPNSFLYSGDFGNTSADGSRGKYGSYWSRSAVSHDLSYSLYFGPTFFYPSRYGLSNKNNGYSIRCLISGS